MTRRSGIVAAGLALSLLLAGLVSPHASSWPDGLEKVAERLGFTERASEEGVWRASPIPDYTLPGLKGERVATGLAGVVGTLVVFALAGGGAWALSRARRAS